MKLTFKSKLLAYSLLLSILPLLLVGMISSEIASKSIQEEVNRNHQTLLGQMQLQIDGFLKTMDNISVQLATNRAIEESVKVGPSIEHLEESWSMISAILHSRTSSEYRFDVSILYDNYDLVYSNRYGLIKEHEFPYLSLIRQKGTRFNGPVLIPPDDAGGRNELLLVRPTSMFKQPSGGILVVHVSVEKLMKLMNNFDAGQGRKIYISDDQGHVILSNTGSDTSRLPDPNGRRFQVATLKSAYNEWSYIVMTPAEGLTEKSQRIIRLTWGMVALLTAVWAFIAVIGSNRMYIPIKRLSSKLQKSSGPQVHADGLQALDAYMHEMALTNEELRRQWNDNLPLMKENVLLRLIWGILHEQEMGRKLNDFRFQLKGSWYRVCIVEWDDFGALQEKYDAPGLLPIQFAFRKMVEENCEELLPRDTCAVVSPQPDQIAVIIGMETAEEENQAHLRLCAQIREKVNLYLKHTVTVAVGSSRKGWFGISSSFQEARGLLNLRMLLGPDATISQNDIEPRVRTSERLMIKRLKCVASEAVCGNRGNAEELLKKWVDELPDYVRHPASVRGLFAYLTGEISSQMQEIGVDAQEIFPEEVYKKLYSLPSVQEMSAWLSEEVFPALQNRLAAMNDSKLQIGKVIHYIHEHFDSDLSLQQLSDEFNLPSSQLSRMFKRETGTNFAEYLIRYRMDKAKQWLERSDMPIKTIAERLRYTTVQNFTRIFKQMEGVPPAAYRKKYRGDAFDSTGSD